MTGLYFKLNLTFKLMNTSCEARKKKHFSEKSNLENESHTLTFLHPYIFATWWCKT